MAKPLIGTHAGCAVLMVWMTLPWAARSVAAAENDAGIEFFEKHIRPVLVERCFGCHSQRAKPPKANLRLDTPAGWLRGGDSGPAVVPGKPAESLILSALRYEDYKMPPDGKLPPAIVRGFQTWIEVGAPVPASYGARVSTDAKQSSIDWPAARQYWSFQPLADPPLPPLAAQFPQQNGIDHYVMRGLDRRQLSAAPAASRRALIRRLTFDLTGLPPTRAQIREFLRDERPQAYQQLVNRLLASPQYGEHWGRHWLDVVRYADSNGADENGPYPLAYHYRNYVIDAFNRDLPFDAFLREQLAGDLLPVSADSELMNRRVTATSFLSLGIKIAAEQDQEKKRADIIDEQLDVIGRSMLGMTIACARCHDHKFDPIPTTDYYAMAGVLRSTKFQTRTLVSPEKARLETEIKSVENALERMRSAAETRIAAASHDHVAEYVLYSRDVVRWRQQAQSAEIRVALSAVFGPPYQSIGRLGPLEGLSASHQVSQAESFQRGNVSVDRGQYGKGIGIISDPGPGGTVWVEYDVELPQGGVYQVEFRYAAASPRPGRLFVNGESVSDKSMSQTTGSWFPDTQQWFVEGRFDFRAGNNVLRFEVDGVMSHLDQWLLAEVDPSPLASRQAERFDRGNVKAFESGPVRFISDPPTNRGTYFVEYDFETAVSGRHALVVRYAASEARPMTLSVDGQKVTEKAISTVTGGWEAEHQRWHRETSLELAAGKHTLRLERRGAVSHIDQWHLVPPAPAAEDARDPQQLADKRGLDRGALEQWADFLRSATRSHPLFELWNRIGSEEGLWPPRIVRWVEQSGPPDVLAERFLEPPVVDDADLARRLATVLREVETAAGAEGWRKPIGDRLVGADGPFAVRRHPLAHYAASEREPATRYQRRVDALRQRSAAMQKTEVMAVGEGAPSDQRVFIRGNHLQPGPRVPRRFLTIVGGLTQAAYPVQQSGRLEMADSIASRRNPLTARVIANRLWRGHFGRAIVKSTENFGRSGATPTHPQLLDHLASKLIGFDWSLKELHRYICNSHTYRMSSAHHVANAASDPENRWYWRFEPRRLPAEAIRDALLFAAQRLDLTVGGAPYGGVKSQDPSPADLRKNRAYYETNRRRSVYLPVVRTNVYKLFTLFDFPNPAAPAGNRSTTTIPTQALFLMNNPWMQGLGDAIADDVLRRHATVADRFEDLFERLLGRLPDVQEIRDGEALMAAIVADSGPPGDATTGWRILAHTLLLSNEFVYVR